MKKLTLALPCLALPCLALISLTFASVAGAKSTVVNLYNATGCTADFYAISNGLLGTVLNETPVNPYTLTPVELSFFPTSAAGYRVKAAPDGTFAWYDADFSCSKNPGIAYLSCVKNSYGKCTSIKLQCSYVCPDCTPPASK